MFVYIFFQFHYTDNVDECMNGLDFTALLDLCSLAEMYGFNQLWQKTKMKISQELVRNYINCFPALEHNLDDNLHGVAFAVLKKYDKCKMFLLINCCMTYICIEYM